MQLPLSLLLTSLASAGGSFVIGGPSLTLPLAVSLLAATAAVILVATALLRGTKGPGRTARTAGGSKPQVVIDGFNVMHWDGEEPRLAALKDVIATLHAGGCQTGVVFDANAGYKLCDRYLSDRDFAKLLGLPRNRVMVVNKGEPADPTILSAARDLKAKIVSNDRFRDWVRDFPEVAAPGLLIRGGFTEGTPWFEDAALRA
ncbi:NYN domain-containing protein [Jannaschia sp. CCS1]|uniref:NYN domain-containing protein n=1 Tax=Jannaschia sp. (strain CCS1) TaxID=290400 RepID=UPI000053A0AA|nr:hypothetical protein [Jannaschia sp. CCS1]ABD56520.1 hypothetical protein Jann_3603 [Jannaschia sp. CCS1]